MAISEKKILEIWRGWCFFFHKNPLYELLLAFFFLVATSPLKKNKKKKEKKIKNNKNLLSGNSLNPFQRN